jgi:membrane protein
MKRQISAIAHWLRRVVTEPLGELNRWQMAVRFAYDLGRFGARQLQYDRAQQMAAALAFRTLFGLLPILVVATILVRAVGSEERYLDPLGQLFDFWGLDTVRIIPPTTTGGESSITLSTWLEDRVREAEQVNVTAIGWVGVVVTIYAAISLLVTIENCFNIIYRAPQGRAWTARVPIYWFALTMSPVLIILSSYLDSRFQQLMDAMQFRGWMSTTAGFLWGLFAIWVIMFCVYLLFPNTRVRLRPAMVGALVAAVLLEIGKRTMGMYLQHALAIGQLYGSLGLVPLFMFWVYLMWLVVLFGLQVSSTLQNLRGRQLAEVERRRHEFAIVDPAAVALMMKLVAESFAVGRSTTVEEIARAMDLPAGIVERIVERLVEHQLVHRLAEPENSITLSRPPEAITIRSLLEVAHRIADRDVEDAKSVQLLEQFRQAQASAAGDRHLASLLELAPASPTAV